MVTPRTLFFASYSAWLTIMAVDYNDGTSVHKGEVGIQMTGSREPYLC